MSTTIRKNLTYAKVNRAFSSINYSVLTDIHQRLEFLKQTIIADEELTDDEKTEAINKISEGYDTIKVLNNEGTRRTCENCNQECLATSYCEYCVRDYLKENFTNWTSENANIDELLQNCQLESLAPNNIIEWIPYDNLNNIEYLTKGGFSEIYTALWINGRYDKWDSKNQRLIRYENIDVVLKTLENVESANQIWLEEAKTHLSISNKNTDIVKLYGLSRDTNGNYVLVMGKLDMDLRKYLQQNHNQLTWKERIRIAYRIAGSLDYITREEKAIHRDLHSGNILYSQKNDTWRISDLGFCGPADKPLNSIYGNIRYTAPEVIGGKGYSFKSDIYSVAMLMWEISSGQPPFYNYKDEECKLALDIINGMRPKIVSGTPLEYRKIMVQCWDADPSKRLDIYSFRKNMSELYLSYQNMPDEPFQPNNSEIETSTSDTNSSCYSSKVYQFENLPEPKNATEDDDEIYNNPNLHSENQDEFEIPDDGF